MKLINIAEFYDIPVVSAHRALGDCQMLAACLSKVDDLDERLEKSMIGKPTYKAIIGFEQRDLAKEEGFYWDGLSKSWCKKMLEEETAGLKFDVVKIKEAQ